MTSDPGAHPGRLAGEAPDGGQLQSPPTRVGELRARRRSARVAPHLCDMSTSSPTAQSMRAIMRQAESRFFPLIESAAGGAPQVRQQHPQEPDRSLTNGSKTTPAESQITLEPDLSQTTAARRSQATSQLPSSKCCDSDKPITMTTTSAIMRRTRGRHTLSNSVAWLLLASLALCHLRQPNQVSCQTGPADAFLGPAESRAESALGPTNLLHKQPSGQNLALDQLVQFLSSINNQKQQQQQQPANGSPQQQQIQQRRAAQPLPLGTMGNQRAALPQPVSSSTPVNPFLGAQFQPTRRQQVFSAHQQQQPNSLSNFVPSSSPSTPLTLNRLQFSTNAMQHNQRFSGLPLAGPLQPMNNVPMGAFSNQRPSHSSPQRITSSGAGSSSSNNNNNNSNNNQEQQSQQRANQFQVLQQPAGARSPLMPPPSQQMNGQQPARPIISGFAPSGPPPGSATNNAINVVQSPANAIGQQSSQSPSRVEAGSTTTSSAPASTSEPPTRPIQQQATTAQASTSTSTSTTTTAAPTTTSATSTTTSSAAPSSEQQPGQQQAATTGTLISASSGSEAAQASSGGEPGELIGAEASLASATNTWSPVNNRTSVNRQQATSLAPSPDIVTVPAGYDPNAPAPAQSYDIAVSAQMGPSAAGAKAAIGVPESVQATVAATPALSIVAQPTETTTIIWSSESGAPSATLAPNRVGASTTASASASPTASTIAPSRTLQESNSAPAGQQQTHSTTLPSRIRDTNSMQNDEPDASSVVYGKRQPALAEQPTGRASIQTAPLDAQVRPFPAGGTLKSNHGGASSAPFKPSRPLNGNQMGGSGVSVAGGFTIVAHGNQSMPNGDIQDYIAGAPPPIVSASSVASSNGAEPTISAHGGPDPAHSELAPEASSASRLDSAAPGSGAGGSASTQAPRLRRPTFKPKPAVPPIRIDSCIVGDDTSCEQSHNERCVTEYGISSCHCKPGFARLSQLRGYCSPISLLQFNLKIERLSDERKLAFNHTLENPNSEEYQYLEFETIQALASAIQQTALAKQFMGARLNKFHERKGKVWANVSINLEANNVTRSERVQQLAGQELAKLVQSRRGQPLGESTLVMDGARESISKLIDVNECASRDLNDCSKHATCTNEFGGYSCQCLPGFEDRLLAQTAATQTASSGAGSATASGSPTTDNNKSMAGRVCMGCSASYCSNRGDCSIVEGKKQCKCRANFMGARCDIDSEILFVAIGGSLVGLLILLVTFWCLFVFNRRWRREQQKMDAMSATSGLTYNYVNAGSTSANSSNSLMSPLRAAGPIAPAPLGRGSAGAYLGAGHQRRHSHFGASAADQQAIMGSSSSGSSAASQPIACNPYAAQYQYEDAGLLIAPASTAGSSEQTSPGASSYRGASNYLAAGSAYTLSGHHHHHHHHLVQQQQQQQQQQEHQLLHQPQLHQHHQGGKQPLSSQFHPALDYARTLNISAYQQHHHMTNGYDTRWRTLQQLQHDSKQQLAGYYLVR